MQAVFMWGAIAGIVHFVAIGALYGNPFVDRMYTTAAEPSVRRWSSKPRYLATQFAGTQIEVWILTAAFWFLRPAIDVAGYAGAIAAGLLLAAVRVYPRFWNMWIQTTYPRRLLAVEIVNGTIGTLVIAVFLQAIALR
jgi:hypothetical protein